MNRVVILGRGGAGKSTLARRLGARTGLPVIELDTEFWPADLEPRPPDDWARHQADLAARDRWIMDGDLGPHDVLEPRLRRADTVVILNLPLWLCATRALRRGARRLDFWSWTINWRRRDLPRIRAALDAHASKARIVVLDDRRAVSEWLQG